MCSYDLLHPSALQGTSELRAVFARCCMWVTQRTTDAYWKAQSALKPHHQDWFRACQSLSQEEALQLLQLPKEVASPALQKDLVHLLQQPPTFDASHLQARDRTVAIENLLDEVLRVWQCLAWCATGGVSYAPLYADRKSTRLNSSH